MFLPTTVEAVISNFMTCEFTTLGKNGAPLTWPVMPIYWPERGQFVLFTSIGLAQKAINVRNNPRVSMLFSEPLGSDLHDPPAVLVQGVAVSPDSIPDSFKSLGEGLFKAMEAQAINLLRRQPGMQMYMSNRISRALMGWYFMRLMITITPQRVLWWEAGDFTRAPQMLEVAGVG